MSNWLSALHGFIGACREQFGDIPSSVMVPRKLYREMSCERESDRRFSGPVGDLVYLSPYGIISILPEERLKPFLFIGGPRDGEYVPGLHPTGREYRGVYVNPDNSWTEYMYLINQEYRVLIHKEIS